MEKPIEQKNINLADGVKTGGDIVNTKRIKNSAFLAFLDDNDLDELIHYANVRLFSAGEYITLEGTKSDGKIRFEKDLTLDISGKNIIIVEDIIDTGNTIKYLKKHMKRKNPKSIRVASLLMKPDSSDISTKIDWLGFEISSEFVVGYGLDYNQEFRNLNAIYKLGEAI